MRRWAVVAALLLGAACAEDPTDDAAAVEAMVLETCAPPTAGASDVADPVCRCAYEALLEEYGSEELARLDSALRHDPDALPEEARRLVLDCAFDVVAPDVPPVPTTEADSSTTTEDGDGGDGGDAGDEPEADGGDDETTTTD